MFWLNCTFDYAVILAAFICTISTFELKLKQQIVGPCQLLKGVTWTCVTVMLINVFSLPKVNNPVSVLTQEMSKYFLHSKGEGDKYKVSSEYLHV